MFEQALMDTAIPAARKRNALLGVMTQATLLTAAVMIPMMFPEMLPMARLREGLTAPPPPLPPRHIETQIVSVQRASATPLRPNVFTEPTSMPPVAQAIEDPPPAMTAQASGPGDGVVGAVGIGDGTSSSHLLRDIVSSAERARPVAPPPVAVAAPPKPTAEPKAPLRVSSGVQEAMLIRRIVPEYPPMAKTMRVQGTVQLVGHISSDGRIRELKVLSGHPLLVKAALEAVSQWVYRPTMLNGEPVEVIAPITVTFTLR